MAGALAARVEATEEVHEGLEGGAVVGGGFVREAGHHSVEKAPGGSTEFGSKKGEKISFVLDECSTGVGRMGGGLVERT